jgi:Ca2+-transporting ATPase
MQKVPGLTHEQVKEQLQKYGENVIEDKNKTTWDKILIRQFKDNKIIYLLIVSVVLSTVLGEILTAVTISLVIILVIIVGFIQEFKAEQAVQALRNMTKSITRVFRNGKIHEIESSQLVPHDWITLRSGDIVPADCLIVEGKAIHVNESVLTGESQEVIKDKVELYTGEHDLMTSEECHRLYMGTMILKGKCTVIVTHTGMNTKIGGIAHLIEDTEKKIMLTGKVNHIINFMILLGVGLGIFSSLLLFLRASEVNTAVIVEIVLFFIAFTVSAFPEAIPVVMMATFTTGARRMASRNVIVNRMGIIETLGEVNVICADKTGTLTKGQMTVQEIITDGKHYHVTGSGFSSNGKILHQQVHAHINENSSLQLFLRTAIVCNDSSIHQETENTDFQIVGSATEGALLIAAHKGGLHPDDFSFEIIEEYPFDSERKMMSVITKEESQNVMYSKGAPETILHKCTHIHTNQGIQPLSDLGKQHLLRINELLGQKGMRTIACGYKSLPHGHATSSEHELVFLGLAAMEDAPHEQAAQAVFACQTAGITVKMITGDQAPTANSIARQVGIYGRVITGTELESLSDDELAIQVKDIGIFARVKPEHKYRIVKALKDGVVIVKAKVAETAKPKKIVVKTKS